MSTIEVEIFDSKTGERRFVKGKAGDVIMIKKTELVIQYYPSGVIREGDPILYLEPRKAQ